jgi:hypothetical protein
MMFFIVLSAFGIDNDFQRFIIEYVLWLPYITQTLAEILIISADNTFMFYGVGFITSIR